jgi:hypothetical protein
MYGLLIALYLLSPPDCERENPGPLVFAVGQFVGWEVI